VFSPASLFKTCSTCGICSFLITFILCLFKDLLTKAIMCSRLWEASFICFIPLCLRYFSKYFHASFQSNGKIFNLSSNLTSISQIQPPVSVFYFHLVLLLFLPLEYFLIFIFLFVFIYSKISIYYNKFFPSLWNYQEIFQKFIFFFISFFFLLLVSSAESRNFSFLPLISLFLFSYVCYEKVSPPGHHIR